MFVVDLESVLCLFLYLTMVEPKENLDVVSEDASNLDDTLQELCTFRLNGDEDAELESEYEDEGTSDWSEDEEEDIPEVDVEEVKATETEDKEIEIPETEDEAKINAHTYADSETDTYTNSNIKLLKRRDNKKSEGAPLVEPRSSSRLPVGCSTTLPTERSGVWQRVTSIITDNPEASRITIDPKIRLERRLRLRKIAKVWLEDLLREANSFGRAYSIDEPEPSIVSKFGHLFLKTADPDMWADFVLDSFSEEFTYIVMAPDFKPEHLLKLRNISRDDFEWGGYFDIFTDEHGDVSAWYHGSATAFGGDRHRRPSGLIGRLLSYFPGSKAEAKFEHERFLKGEKGQGLSPNFRVAFTIKPQHTNLHKCWTYGLESLTQSLTTLNVGLPGDGQYRTDTIGPWTAQFRQKVGFPTFENVYPMNKCLPLRQGIPNDRRFNQSGPRKCANPEADCPQTEGPWVLLHKHLPMSIERLCQACRKYRDWCGKFRTQELIDAYHHRLATEEDGCWWCLRDFPPKSVHDRRRPIKDLDNDYVCKDCYSFWKEGSTLLPIPGVHFQLDAPFMCEGDDCGLHDRSRAPGWCFKDGMLLCVQCWSDGLNTKASRLKVANIKKAGTTPHVLNHTDCKWGNRRRGWVEYMKVKFAVCVTGTTLGERIVAIRALKEKVRDVDVVARNS